MGPYFKQLLTIYLMNGVVYYLGTLIGCLIAGILGDKMGRLRTMFIGCLWILVGAALQCSAQNLAWYVCTLLRELFAEPFSQDALCTSDKRYWNRLP